MLVKIRICVKRPQQSEFDDLWFALDLSFVYIDCGSTIWTYIYKGGIARHDMTGFVIADWLEVRDWGFQSLSSIMNTPFKWAFVEQLVFHQIQKSFDCSCMQPINLMSCNNNRQNRVKFSQRHHPSWSLYNPSRNGTWGWIGSNGLTPS